MRSSGCNALAYSTVPCKDNIKIIRIKGYNYVHPILIAELHEESAYMLPIKQKIENIVQKVELTGVKNISVFLLILNKGDWTGVNEDKQFNSSGFIRLAILITCQKLLYY